VGGSARNLILWKYIKIFILKFSIPCILYINIHFSITITPTEASTINNLSISRFINIFNVKYSFNHRVTTKSVQYSGNFYMF
jgi:hypothetical protein